MLAAGKREKRGNAANGVTFYRARAKHRGHQLLLGFAPKLLCAIACGRGIGERWAATDGEAAAWQLLADAL